MPNIAAPRARPPHAFLLAASLLSLWVAPAAGLSMEYDHSREVAPGASIRWTIAGDEIMLCLQAKAAGWVGFGLAEVGGMKGADIVYYEAKANALTDAFAVENGMPKVDECSQDWELRATENLDGVLTVEMSRKLAATDAEDRSFDTDASLPLAATPIILAWGDTDAISYHAEKRAKAHVRFHQLVAAAGNPLTILQRIEALKADATVLRAEMKQDNHPISSDRGTEYHETCYALADVVTASASGAYHIIGFEALIDPATAQHVHHYVVSAAQTCDEEMMTVVWLWGPGSDGYVLPEEAGVRILEGGFKAMHIQIHYDNPSKVPGMLDSSGFAILYTEDMRQYDAGILQLGDPNLLLFAQPIKDTDGAGYSQLTVTNPARYCTNLWEAEEVTVFERFMHMHKAGERMVTKQYREGELLRTDYCDYYDFFESGGFSPRSTTSSTFKIKKGDTFDVECYYYSSEKMIRFGLASDDEMCIDFLYYYPLQQEGSVCNPSLDTLQPPNALNSVVDLGRKFGTCGSGAVGLAPAWGVSLVALVFAGARAVYGGY